ncbi:MAG: 2OG-Fe(II) oxygenase [Polyangiaceae bacterium]
MAAVVDISEAPADAVAAIYAGELLGIRINGAWSPADCAAADAALGRVPFTEHPLEPTGSLRTYGKMLAPSAVEPLGPSLTDYFADVDQDTGALEALFPAGFRAPLSALLSRAAGDRPVRVLDRPHPHRPATVREIAPGAAAEGHVDTYADSPAFTHLHEHTDRAVQLSFYVQLRVPEAGGQLEIAAAHRDRGEAARLATRTPVALAVGDLVLFDAANHYHHVTEVRGPHPRRTIGGFAALSRDHGTLYFWG